METDFYNLGFKGVFPNWRKCIPQTANDGFFLEVLIAKKFERTNSGWRFDPTGYAKDITNLNDEKLSIEIKTSSSKNKIYGNRSFANPGSSSKKSKDSFYLAINFEKFNKESLQKTPTVTLIRFGYLEHTDWIGQKAQSGQQARLKLSSEKGKLLELWPKMDSLFLT